MKQPRKAKLITRSGRGSQPAGAQSVKKWHRYSPCTVAIWVIPKIHKAAHQKPSIWIHCDSSYHSDTNQSSFQTTMCCVFSTDQPQSQFPLTCVLSLDISWPLLMTSQSQFPLTCVLSLDISWPLLMTSPITIQSYLCAVPRHIMTLTNDQPNHSSLLLVHCP